MAAAAAAAGAILIKTLQISSSGGILDQFNQFLEPIRNFLPLDSSSAAAARGGGSRKTSASASQRPKKKAEEDLRPLAKQFLPFICETLKIIPDRLRRPPQSSVDEELAKELFAVYKLLTDCLWCISQFLDGKPSAVLLHRGRLVRYLESWGLHAKAGEEALSLLAMFRESVVPVPKGKGRAKAKAPAPGCLIPGLELVAADDLDAVSLVAEILTALACSAFKSKTTDQVAYERILDLGKQILPWLRTMGHETAKKYHSQLVNVFYKCAVFLAGKALDFEGDLVKDFCLAMSRECLESSYRDRFLSIVRTVCSSPPPQWNDRPLLIFEMMRIALDSIVPGCEADMMKMVNDFLEFVSYCADNIILAGMEICNLASDLLYKRASVFIQDTPVAAILILYATGLFLKCSNLNTGQSDLVSQKTNGGSVIMLLLDNGKMLQNLTDSLCSLTRYFQISRHRNEADSDVVHLKHGACNHFHGHDSLLSYMDGLEFLCKLLVEYVNTDWKHLTSETRVLYDSANVKHIQDTLLQFYDLVLAAIGCTKICSRDIERLQGSRKTLIQVVISALKISFMTVGNYQATLTQESLFSVDYVISCGWIDPQELKFLISSLSNIGASLHDTGHLEQAPVALELCCKAIWMHVKVLLKMYSDKSEGICDDVITKNAIEVAIRNAYTRSALILNMLHKCGATNVHDIAVKSLIELSAAEDAFQNCNSSLGLVKQWVKIMCKDFEKVDVMDKVLLLRDYSRSEKMVGDILEQVLLAFEILEARNPILCQKMCLNVMDIMLDDVYVTGNYNIQKSRILFRKGRVLRSCGTGDLKGCMKCLSEAISLMIGISGDPRGNISDCHQLALMYCLYALCGQEANDDFQVILKRIKCALKLWSDMDILGHYSTDSPLNMDVENAVPLLCNIADLLALKGCLEFDLYKLIFIFCKWGNIPMEKCLGMLWTGRKLNHSLCTTPIDGDLILSISKFLDIRINSVEYWIDSIHDPHSLLMFFQKLLLCDSILPEVSSDSSGRFFGSKVSIDEVKNAVSTLISDVPLTSKVTFIAGYLYHDLSERLLSLGHIFEALPYAREALRLRKKILQRKFSYSLEHKFAESAVIDKRTQNNQNHSSLESIGSVTEFWPDVRTPVNLEELIISPWTVLRSYLDSTLQVGMLHESTGNGIEAESIFQTGESISHSQGLPIYEIAFASLLGQLYCKKESWVLAKNEFNRARSLLEENDEFITCKHCKLSFEVTIQMQLGDLSRSLFEKGLQELPEKSIPDSQDLLEKLNHKELMCSSICEEIEASGAFISTNHVGGAKHSSKLSSSAESVKSPVCHICTYLDHSSNINHAGQKLPDTGTLPTLKNKDGATRVDIGVKRRSRNQSKCLQKEPFLNAEPKSRRTRSSNQSCSNKRANECEVDNLYDRSAIHEYCSDNPSLEQSKVKQNGSSPDDFVGSGEYLWDRTKCWRCFLIEVSEAGTLKDILSLKWECHRRCISLKLLARIARCYEDPTGSHCTHNVHDVFWRCISLLFHRQPFSKSSPLIRDSRLIKLIEVENADDIFSIERAELLYNMSWLSLKVCISEKPRSACCNLSKVKISNILPWLFRAFILCRELPLLFQKVSKLLSSAFILSTLCEPTSLPFSSDSSLSPNHWAAYFHQASVGTYLHWTYLSCVKDKTCSANASECLLSASRVDTTMKDSNYLRFAPEKTEELENFVRDFFQDLPTIPIVCISMLGSDYVSLLGELLFLHSYFPSWMLLTRIDAKSQPIVMLLPVDFIVQDLEISSSSKEIIHANKGSIEDWLCPWSYTIVDYVAPSFKLLLEENFLSLSNTSQADANLDLQCWWSERTRLNDQLNKLLKSMEDSWLGPWGCLLLGARPNSECLDTAILKLIDDMRSQCKSVDNAEKKCNIEVNINLLKAVLSGAKSVDDAETCISQLLLYKGNIGWGSCCEKERFRTFFSACHTGTKGVTELSHNLISEVIGGPAETIDREPVILVLDSDVQMLPWENLPILRNQEVYRMPSVTSISITLDRCCLHKATGGSFPSIDPFDAYYLLNPSGDLSSTQAEFEQWFRNQNLEGKAGVIPTIEELALALQNHDLFLYFGHGSGIQYIPGHEIQKLDHCAATLLMGCSSGSLFHKGCYAPRGAPLFYLFAGSPAVIANLWDVSDKDIDRFSKAMLKSWLHALDSCICCDELVRVLGRVSIEGEGNATTRNRRKNSRGKKSEQLFDKDKCKVCGGRKRIASFMGQARDACKLPFLIGAAPVCYGVPTVVRKKS